MEERKRIIEDLVSVSQKTAKWMREKKEADLSIVKNTMGYKKYKKKYKQVANLAEKFNRDLKNSKNPNPNMVIFIPSFKDFTFWIYRNHYEKEIFKRSIHDRYMRHKGLDQLTLQI